MDDADENAVSLNGTLANMPACRDGLYVVGQLHRVSAWGSGSMLDPEERVRRIADMGFGGTRLAFEWSELEPTRGVIRWGTHDRLVGELRKRGLHAFGIVLFSPAWARPPGEDRTHRPVIGGSPARGDTAYAAFAAAAARRYRGVIDRWEIWNEPNILVHHFWRHAQNGVELGPDPTDYLPLYELARDSILAANPSAKVSVGALANGPPWGPVLSADPNVRWEWGYSAWAFLRGLLDAGLRPSDLSFHPYSYKGPVAVNPSLDSVKAVLDEYGFGNTRLWITEWAIDYGLQGLSPEMAVWQTKYGLNRLCADPRIDLVTVYILTQTGGREYSLMRSDGSITLAGRAVRDWIDGRRDDATLPGKPAISIP